MPEKSDTSANEGAPQDEAFSHLIKAYIDQQINKATEGENRSHKKKWNNAWRSASPITKLTVYLSGAVALSTIAYAFIALSQLSVMKASSTDTTEQTKKLIKAAEMSAHSADHNATAATSFAQSADSINKGIENAVKALHTQATQAQAQFGITQRPYMVIVTTPRPLIDQKPSIDIRQINYGKSPATHVLTQGEIFIGEDALAQADRWFKEKAFNPNISFRNFPQAITIPFSESTRKEVPFSTLTTNVSLTPDLLAKNFTFVVAGRIIYSDLNGGRYYTDFCSTRLQSGAEPWCDKHNDIH